MTHKLYILGGPETYSLEAKFPTYAEALTVGQSHGYGLFFIDSGSYVPSREEQLGLSNAKPLRKQSARGRKKYLQDLPD